MKNTFKEKEPTLDFSKRILFLILILVHLLDLYFTQAFIYEDVLNEANPIMKNIYINFGIVGLLLTKIMVLVFLGLLLPNVRIWVLFS